MRTEDLKPGIKNSVQTVVDKNNTAAAVGSGILQVFSTPMMLALMEKAACELAAQYLDEGEGTVGTKLNITHDAATPVGMTVTAEAELTEVDGRRLVFNVTAYDETGRIGGGVHERFVIQNAKFQARTDAKLVR